MNAAQRDVQGTVLTCAFPSVGLPKVIVRDEEAADTFRMASQPVSECVLQPETLC